MRVPPYGVEARTAHAGCARTSPMTRASPPPGSVRASSAASAYSGATTAGTVLRWLCAAGPAQQLAAPRTASRTGTRSSQKTPSPQSRATVQASRRRRGGIAHPSHTGPGGFGQASTNSITGAYRKRGPPPDPTRRAPADDDSVIADGTERRMASPGRAERAEHYRPGMRRPTPAVVMYMRSALPCSTTLCRRPRW